MLRQIIEIDEEKCTGCGICERACHEGAIKVINGKAKLTREDFCDGFGDCLPGCPENAIRFITKDVPAYNEELVLAAKKEKEQKTGFTSLRSLGSLKSISTPLINWPVQMKLAPTSADYYENADLLIAADCTAYAYANFHKDFMEGKATLIGCPKLDAINYADKLAEILRYNSIQSITLARMEVPCCRGLERALQMAIEASSKDIPLQIVIISTKGKLL